MIDPETEKLMKAWLQSNLEEKASKFTMVKDWVGVIGGLLGLPVAFVAVIALMDQSEKADAAKEQATIAENSEAEAVQSQETEVLIAAAKKVAEEDEEIVPESPLKDQDEKAIDQFVDGLFSTSGSTRATAYKKLTHEFRAKGYAVDRILQLGKSELEKDPESQSYIGVYHTIVTLTDMSRAVTQIPTSRKDRILDYANSAESAFPKLSSRIAILRKWLDSKR